MMRNVQIANCSLPGSRSHNEDDLRHGAAVGGHYAVLADGAGGHWRGGEAARRAVDCLERLMRDGGLEFSPASLSAMVRQAHRMVLAHQESGRAETRMHSTLVALWIDSGAQHALWSHVGDSRLYRFRYRRADVVTSDDSVVQRMLQTGLISPEQARHHPQKNQLVAALGIEGDIDPHTVARPVEVLDGDAFLLCSDGWWDAIEHQALLDSLARALSPANWLTDMRQHIEARAVPRQDNFSAVAVWIGDPGEVMQPGAEDTLPRMIRPG